MSSWLQGEVPADSGPCRMTLGGDFRGILRFLPLLAYAALIIVLLSLRAVPFTGYETDGVFYMIHADTFFTDAFQPPTYGGGIGMPLAIRFAKNITRDTFAAAKIVSAAAGFLYLAASLRVMSRISTPAIGFVSALLLLVNPTVLIYSSTSLSDMLAASFVMTAVWLLTEPQKTWRVFGAGVFLGLGWMVRSINIAFWPLVLISIWGKRESLSPKKLVLGLLGIFLGSLPQLLVNVEYFGNPFYTDNWRNIATALYGTESFDKIHSFGEIVRHDWLQLCYVWAKQFTVQMPVKLHEVAYLPFLLAVPGYIFLLRLTRERALCALWGGSVVLYAMLVALVWRIEARYFLPILPVVMISGVVMWRKMVNENKYVYVIGVVLALLISSAASFKNIKELVAKQALEFKQAGLFLEHAAGHEDIVLASQPHVFFYAQRQGLLFENLSSEEVADLKNTVNNKHITWIVFDERQGAVKFSTLSYLLKTNLSYGWHLAFMNKESPRILVWQANHP